MPSPLFRRFFGKTLKSGLSRSTNMILYESVGPDVPAGDVTPNAVNWQNIGYDEMSGMFLYSEVQITGINQTITLKLQYTGDAIYVYTSNTAGDIVFGYSESGADPVALGMTTVNNNGTFTVTNGKYVTFGCYGGISTYTVTVVNQSDGNAVLDTFTAGPIGGGPG